MRVAFLTRYDERRASSRVRAYQYRPHLEAKGFAVRILPWGAPPRRRWPGYLTRALLLARWADVVVLQKPFQPTWFVDLLARINPRLVVDVDDAMWEEPEDALRPETAEIGRRVDHAARVAGVVITGSAHLAGVLTRRVPGIETHVLPSPVEIDSFVPHDHVPHRPVVAGWVGSPENLADFEGCGDALHDAVGAGDVRLRIVSSRGFEAGGPDAELVPWRAADEATEVARFDIGLMPLRDTPRTRGRCGFKAIQYAAAGVPVIASRVPGPCEVVEDGVTGLIVDGPDGWRDALRRLADDHQLRVRLGAAGRAAAETRYSTRVTAPALAAILADRAARELPVAAQVLG